MISLHKYLVPPTYNMEIDGHIHLFNHKSPIDISILPYKKFIGFMDIEFDEDYDCKKCYDNFIKSYYNKDKHILLATATNIEDIESIYNEHKDVIKGFGELKCYDTYKGENVPYKKIGFVRQVCKFSSEHGNLPIYIHWEFNSMKDYAKLNKVIKDYPRIPLILCHCGTNEWNQDAAINSAVELSKQYNNIWLDCTFTALEYFAKNPLKILNLPTNRIILGSDINNKNFGPGHNPEKDIKEIVNNNTKISHYIDSDSNIKKLFNI